jgi:hypothetical protein
MAIWIREAANHGDRGERVRVPAVTAAEQQHHLRHRGNDAGDGGSHRRRQDVPVVDVHQFMAEDAAQFAGVQHPHDALRAADGRVLRVPAGGEGVRRHGGRDVDARHRLVGPAGQLPDDLV